MKIVLLIALLVIIVTGFTHASKERFYVFGYSATQSKRQNVGVFWISLVSPKFPSVSFVKSNIQEYNKDFSNILITSMYEFKGKEDYLESQK